MKPNIELANPPFGPLVARPSMEGEVDRGRAHPVIRTPHNISHTVRKGPCPSNSAYNGHSSSDTVVNIAVSRGPGQSQPLPSSCGRNRLKDLVLESVRSKEILHGLSMLIHCCGVLASRLIWIKELISFVGALSALAIMVTMLATHQDKMLPKWPTLISINSLISILTSIFKATMLLPVAEGISELKWVWFVDSRPLSDMDCFDSASRGPLGAFTLFKRPDSLLALFGASITIFALAIDPFSQQVLQYYDCLQPLGGIPAIIPRTNNYTTMGTGLLINWNSPDDPMTTAFYQGILDPSAYASASIATSCQSGNCTFRHVNGIAYNSLAMCSSVKDISDLVSVNSKQLGDNFTYLENGTSVANHYDQRFHYSLPGEVGPITVCPDTSATICEPESVFASASSNSLQNKSEESALFTFKALMLKGDTTPWALEASLYPCVHAYGSAGVSKSIFEEHIVTTIRLPFMSVGDSFRFSLAGNYPSMPGTDCTPSNLRQGNKTYATNLFASGLRYVSYSVTADAVHDTLWYDPACTYEFGFGATISLLGRLEGFFGSASCQISLGSDGTGSPYLQRLYKNGTADLKSTEAFMQGLADSITSVIRQHGDSTNSVPATGDTLANSTCIHVQWAWLALPAALLVFSLAFSIATAVKSRRISETGILEGHRRAWKSSTLPFFWCGLDFETRKRYGSFDDLREMKDCADKVKVRLVRRDEEGGIRGWKLKAQ